MRPLKIIFCVSLLAVALIRPAFAEMRPTQFYHEETVANTFVGVTVWAKDAPSGQSALDAAFHEFKRMDQLLSAYRQGSEVSAINQFAGQKPVVVSRETMDLIRAGRLISEKTKGVFDITAATFAWQYGFGQGDYHVPSVLRLDQLKPVVNYKLILLYPQDKSVLFKRDGVQIDPDELIRNEALDRLQTILSSRVAAARIRIRNSIAVVGNNPEGPSWEFQMPHPRDAKRFLAVIPFQKGKILSAADNERFFIKDGKRFHCYIDPRNGFPAGQGEAATLLLPEHPTLNLPVSVLLVVPPAEALQLVQSIPGAECLIVDQAQKVWVSPGWSHLAVEKFEAQDPSAGKQGQKKVRP